MGVRPGQRVGRHAILEEIGAGGMGRAYRARDPRLARDVAIKLLDDAVRDDAQRRRFEREAQAVGALRHPSVLVVHDVGLDQVPYLVTELLDGETLQQRLAGGAVNPATAIDLALQVARGLIAAHDAGVIHRDPGVRRRGSALATRCRRR